MDESQLYTSTHNKVVIGTKELLVTMTVNKLVDAGRWEVEAPVLVDCRVSDGQGHHGHAVHVIWHTLRFLHIPVNPARPEDPLLIIWNTTKRLGKTQEGFIFNKEYWFVEYKHKVSDYCITNILYIDFFSLLQETFYISYFKLSNKF